MKTILKPNWNGKELRETVKEGDKTFKIVTGLKNGGGGNTTYFRVLTAVQGAGHQGKPGTGARFSTNSTFCIMSGGAYVRIYDLSIVVDNASSYYDTYAFDLGDSSYPTVAGCLIKATNSNVSYYGYGIRGTNISTTSVETLINNCIYECDGDGIQFRTDSFAFYYNNTVVDCGGWGIDDPGSGSGTCWVKNCIVQGNAGGQINDTNDVFPTTNAESGMSFLDSANDDYHLASTDGNGTDLSATFDDDGDADSPDTRSSWDRGFDEWTSPPASSGSQVIITSFGLGF